MATNKNMNKIHQKVRIKKLREWLKNPPKGMTIVYIMGSRSRTSSWGTTPDSITDELNGYTDNQFVTVTLEKTQELIERIKKIELEQQKELQEQAKLSRLFQPTIKKSESIGDNMVQNHYITYIDPINKIERTDWNGLRGKLIKI